MIEEISGLKKEILKKFGPNAIKTMDEMEKEPFDTISTGSLRLDLALKEPLIYGVHELSGSEGAGKTTIALEAGACAQKKGMTFFYVNMERGLQPSLAQCIKTLDRVKMQVLSPNSGDEALDMVENIIRSMPKSFIVIDSVTALVSEDEVAKSSAEDTMGKLGKMLSKFLKKMNHIINDQKSVLLMLNQVRDNLGYGAKEITTGGRAIRFYSHSRVQLQALKANLRKNAKGQVIGQTIEATVVKNRVTKPHVTVEVELLYGQGIDKCLELLKLATELGIVEKSGAWYKYNNEHIGQGEENACNHLRQNEKLFNDIYKQVFELYN